MLQRRLFATNRGLELHPVKYPVIGQHDVLIEVIASYFSPGTEVAALKSVQSSVWSKAIKFKSQIHTLISNGELDLLISKAKSQLNVFLPTGYSIHGRVVAVGESVDSVSVGQFVVGVGPSACHGTIAVVPKGLVFPVENKPELSASALVSIALNSVNVASLQPFSTVCVLGGGLLGNLITQLVVSAGHTVDVVDLSDVAREDFIARGARKFISREFFGADRDCYDAVITTVPSADDTFWTDVATTTKNYGKVILVGGADLVVPRQSFYQKKLNFLTSYSYGVGRGDYDFEVLGLRPTNHGAALSDVRQLIEKSVSLICEGRVSFDAAVRVDMTKTDPLGILESVDTRNGVFFLWEGCGKADDWAAPQQDVTRLDQENWEKSRSSSSIQLDVVGNSAFFKDSHRPALKSTGLMIRSMHTRSPEPMLEAENKPGNCLLISTPHDEHWLSLKRFPDYEWYFIDKPLVSSAAELKEYLVSRKRVVALMNRRYSAYTKELQSISEHFDDNNVKIEFTFAVPQKLDSDPIFRKGGRIIGEMCHHIDLAIFISGPIKNAEAYNFDSNLPLARQERMYIMLEHENGRSSIIKYWPEQSPFFKKELICLNSGGTYFSISDFSRLNTNIEKYKNKITERDKGCAAMWRYINDSFTGAQENLAEMMRLDRQTYKILSELIF